jgi:membrane protein YdbS with pleckstrin-like domain
MDFRLMAAYKTLGLRRITVEIAEGAVLIRRPKLVGEDTTSIPLNRVQSVDVRTGPLFWRAQVVLHAGDDFVVEGLRNRDAAAIRAEIERAIG